MLKRFLVFGGDNYYPCGGWNDFQGSYETYELALKWATASPSGDWWHIVDSETGEMVADQNGYSQKNAATSGGEA